jgi:hypothetical protein
MTQHFAIHKRSALRLAALAFTLVATTSGGCLDEPEIEDRWTRLDLNASSLGTNTIVSQAALDSITVTTSITYRTIITGVAVAELRASPSLSTADVALGPEAPRTTMAGDIDRLLANSVSLGRATHAITGWDHLIQRIDFGFRATASPGASGYFLVCYLGDGEEVERADGTDTLIVTPFVSSVAQILPVGIELAPPSAAQQVAR